MQFIEDPSNPSESAWKPTGKGLQIPVGVYKSRRALKRACDAAWSSIGIVLVIEDDGKMYAKVAVDLGGMDDIGIIDGGGKP